MYMPLAAETNEADETLTGITEPDVVNWRQNARDIVSWHIETISRYV
jgi:hypothetical protein